MTDPLTPEEVALRKRAALIFMAVEPYLMSAAKVVEVRAAIEGALSKDDAIDRLYRQGGESAQAWAWLADSSNLSVEFCHADDWGDNEWRVHRVNGGVNDREWTVVGRGETPLAAVLNARSALTQENTR